MIILGGRHRGSDIVVELLDEAVDALLVVGSLEPGIFVHGGESAVFCLFFHIHFLVFPLLLTHFLHFLQEFADLVALVLHHFLHAVCYLSQLVVAHLQKFYPLFQLSVIF